METLVVSVRDTNVLLLLAHYDRMQCKRLYMKAGTSKAPKYLPVHEICMWLSADHVDKLLAFHVTECNSSVATVRKKPGKCSSNIAQISLGLEKALSE